MQRRHITHEREKERERERERENSSLSRKKIIKVFSFIKSNQEIKVCDPFLH